MNLCKTGDFFKTYLVPHNYNSTKIIKSNLLVGICLSDENKFGSVNVLVLMELQVPHQVL